jgi:ADP-heptose:LPS heptosyltransferase/SAM-dependent methyltransferase
MVKREWTVRAPADRGAGFSGLYYGVQFVNGEAKVDKQYFRDLLLRKSCSEISCNIIDPDWKPEKILVIRLGAYGDNLMITSALRGLRNKYPDATIHFIGSQPHNSILVNNPHINGIIIAPQQDIGHIIHDYDEVYDLYQHIEHNPESDWENAYDLAERRLDVVDYVDDHTPVFVPTDNEVQEAKNLLTRFGFDPDKKLILIHAESSSMLRRMSIQTALKVSHHFIDKGYKILFAGHDHATPNMEYIDCVSCKKTVAAELVGQVTTTTINCPFCQSVNTVTKTDKNKDILFLHQLLGDVSPRTIFTMQKFVELVIAVDSAHSHIAAALDVPSVLLYGPFDPDLRARYYKKARKLFLPTDCGPCNQLSPNCVIYPKGPPPCMTQYKAEDIIEEAEMALNDKWHVVDNFSYPKYNPEFVKDCPHCQERSFTPLARKGHMYYVRCESCKTIYIDKKWINLDTIYTPNYVASDNPPNYYSSFAHTLQQVANVHNITGPKYLDFGCGDGHLLREMSQRNWEVSGVERPLQADKINKTYGKVYTKLGKLDSKQDLISMIHVIEHIEDPKESLRSLVDYLNKDGILFIYGHDASTYADNNSWLPINTKRTGEHLQIFPREVVDEILKKLGLNILTSRRVGRLDYMITAQKV